VHEPRRRCVGCGRIAPKTELVRITVRNRRSSSDGARGSARAVVDQLGTMGGRGAYLCRGPRPGEPAGGCLALATQRGRIARALRQPIPDRSVTIDPKLVESVSP
jgi:predicted RNA-binding protein YlxR (DUF448 family)